RRAHGRGRGDGARPARRDELDSGHSSVVFAPARPGRSAHRDPEEAQMKTIVVGYDETEGAARALDRAAELAEALGEKLVVTSVAPVLISAARSGGAIDLTDAPADDLAELAHARAQLQG